jgi:serine phosphatase RsbU (regulator of sigma subunit)
VRARSEAHAQRARARARLLRYEAERQVATTLQRSLLTDVPAIAGIDSAARYEAGVTGLEVGGDWYDVVARPDGIVHFTVGDVAGHGIAAAALMGQLRNAFRAYAYDQTSPAAILRRLLRHMGPGEMATAICLTIDPLTMELTYASAGHPPPLMRDDETGAITQLDFAQAPPLGFAAPENVRETRLALPPRATIVAYTDGVIERRDQPIDRGIARLADTLRASGVELSADDLADKLIREVAMVTAASDDIALLVLRLDDLGAAVDRAPSAAPAGSSA